MLMNIMHTETLQGWGGQQNKVVKELLAARELGHNAYLLCPPDTIIGRRARDFGFTVFEFPMHKLNYAPSILFCMRLFRELSIDILITHSSADSWMGALAGIFSSRKVTTLRERHNLHTIVGWPSKWLHRRAFDYLIAISEKVRSYLVEDIGVDPRKVLLLNSVVDVEAFSEVKSTIRAELGIPQDALVIGMFSILRVNKGIHDFLEVVKRVIPKSPNTYAVFGGRTNQHRIDEFNGILQQCGVDLSRVKWTGFRADAANVLKGYDLFVFPSHSEGLGTVLLEAMACRLPIVTYDIRPMSDLIQDGTNGSTVPFRRMDILAQCVEDLLRDSLRRRQYGDAAYASVVEKYNEKQLKTNIQKIFETVTHA